jgi:urocanate hydratase
MGQGPGLAPSGRGGRPVSASTTARRIRAARGPTLRCKGWRQEALLRMLENVLEVGERPEDLVVYTAGARAARNWQAFDGIVRALRSLEQGETLVIQSGKPIGIFSTYADAPLVVMANANLVGRWAVPEVFYELDRRGLTMPAGFTAGGWQYIGTQGIAQGTYMTFLAAAHESFGGTLAGRLVLTSGCGGMGGAQPLAVTLNGGVAMVVEVDRRKIERRVASGYCDRISEDLEETLRLCREAQEARRPFSVGLVGNAAEVLPELLARGVIPDVVTDQTSASDPVDGYIPAGLTLEQAEELRRRDLKAYLARVFESIARHVQAMLGFQAAGAMVFEYGNNIRAQAKEAGVADAFRISNFMTRFIRPFFFEGRGPFRWVAVSGDPKDIARIDELVLREFPDDPFASKWVELARKSIRFEGLPARICWLKHGQRPRLGLRVNELVASGELAGPVAFARDNLDGASVAMPWRETENMPDGSDAVADWPLLNALLNVACRADLVSIHSSAGGAAGTGVSCGTTVIADGTREGALRVEKTLGAETSLGILRYADAGYREAERNALKAGIRGLSLRLESGAQKGGDAEQAQQVER